jgi:hypothetical protein
MGRLTRIVAAVALCQLLAVTVAAAAPTKGQFIRRGDDLCRQVQRELTPIRARAQAAQSLPDAQKWAAVSRLWTDQIRIQARFNLRFRRLGLPAGDATARGLVVGLDRGLLLVRHAFATRDMSAVAAALPAYLRYTLRLNHRVAAYGFKVCGHS